ncbi:MAG TPA: sigma-70 family RNA polymerase sigma factor [Ktedonobacterales bacterium]|jgi:RNA polymerase sigma-70 factor (ECF subfamily)
MRMKERPPEPMSQAAAFWEPVLQMQSALIGFARGLVGDDELARDIAQDAFMDAWQAARRQTPPFDAPAAPDDLTGIRRWLFTVAYRHAIKHLRRGKTIVWQSLDALESLSPSTLHTPGRFEDALAEAEALRMALRSVEPEDAACVLLQVVHGFSTAEIAMILAIRADTVRKRLSRAKQRLRDAYLALSQSESPEG